MKTNLINLHFQEVKLELTKIFKNNLSFLNYCKQFGLTQEDAIIEATSYIVDAYHKYKNEQINGPFLNFAISFCKFRLIEHLSISLNYGITRRRRMAFVLKAEDEIRKQKGACSEIDLENYLLELGFSQQISNNYIQYWRQTKFDPVAKTNEEQEEIYGTCSDYKQIDWQEFKEKLLKLVNQSFEGTRKKRIMDMLKFSLFPQCETKKYLQFNELAKKNKVAKSEISVDKNCLRDKKEIIQFFVENGLYPKTF